MEQRLRKLHAIASNIPRRWKRWILMAIDGVCLPICLWFAYVLRFSEPWPSVYIEPQLWFFPFVSLAGISIFSYFRIYNLILHYINQDVLLLITKSFVTLSATLMLVGFFAVNPTMPRSIPFIFALLCGGYLTMTRFFYRQYYQWVLAKVLQKDRVLIFGAGGAGVQLATALQDSEEYRAVAFMDDNRNLSGAEVAGLKIYHPNDLDDVINSLNIKHVLLAIPSASIARKKAVIARLVDANVDVLTMPSFAELITGHATIDTLSTVQTQDLLGRDAVVADEALLRQSLEGKVVLISGAGGSIGSEICRQVIQSNPRQLLLFEISEYALYQISAELKEIIKADHLDCELVSLLGDVCDPVHVSKTVKHYGVQIIYHAAAYKHVPLVEDNALVAIKNNVFGTQILCQIAHENAVERFILISSDKAVRSTSIMGATKRMSELIVQERAKASGKTIFAMVRFGNVLGSSGSVEPLFRKQINAGGPVTVTDPDVTRYFMTIPEASSLVIQAGSMASGGEVFILEMGQKVKIIDLARRMIQHSGLKEKTADNPEGDIEIKITGLRPGEKITEELTIGEATEKTKHPYIFKVYEEGPDSDELALRLKLLNQAVENYEASQAIASISGVLTGYSPQKANETNGICASTQAEDEHAKIPF